MYNLIYFMYKYFHAKNPCQDLLSSQIGTFGMINHVNVYINSIKTIRDKIILTGREHTHY